MSHTPGPWRYFKQGDSTRFHVTARPPTKPGNSFDDFATVDVGHEADARLIAAAPELLAALQQMIYQFDAGQLSPYQDGARNVYAAVDSARAALAKATGADK